MYRVFLGSDSREQNAFIVAESSIFTHTKEETLINALDMNTLRKYYTRPTERRDGKLWDVISEAPMSTEHAIARFFVPILCGYYGWALFCDCDVMLREDLKHLFDLCDNSFAVKVVQHDYTPVESVKMDGQVQTQYSRKNWSSVILWNCGHPANRALTLDVLNSWPGRDLHAFKWLRDAEIGALPAGWNYLVGVEELPRSAIKLAHFTLGTPDMPSYENCELAEEWSGYLYRRGK